METPTIATTATVAAVSAAKRPAAKRFSVAEQAAMMKVLLASPQGALGYGPSGAALSALASELGDTVERVTSWVGRARFKARAEHNSAGAARERAEKEEKEEREAGLKRKAEAAAEALVVEKRRQLTFFRETDDIEALRSKVLELMPVVDTVARLQAIVDVKEAAEATLRAKEVAAKAKEVADAAAAETRANDDAACMVAAAPMYLRRDLKAQMVYQRGMGRKQLAAEVQNFSPLSWTLMHALATRHGGSPSGANTFSLGNAAVGLY
jgi:hypothetical protein